MGSLLMHRQIHHSVGWGGLGRPPPQGGPNLLGLFTETSVAALVTGRGVPGRGVKSDQSTGSLFALPCTGINCDPGGG